MERQYPGCGTLCWDCANTNRFKCTWFDPDNQQPVPGWVAEMNTVRSQRWDGTAYPVDLISYHVYRCPNFEPVSDEPYLCTTIKPVKNLDTGEVYSSLKRAAAAYGREDGSNISKACRTPGFRAFGHRWAYLEDCII